MYDILQLNDMLVPELLDIAEQLKIHNAKKLDKQGLIYKILDSQAIAGSKGASHADDKGKRKRIVKTTTGITSEEAVVESTGEEKSSHKKPTMPAKKEEKPIVKKGRKKVDEKEPVEVVIAPEPEQEEEQIETPPQQPSPQDNGGPMNGGDAQSAPNKIYPQRRDQQFNIEFDGVILGEGVLEIAG